MRWAQLPPITIATGMSICSLQVFALTRCIATKGTGPSKMRLNAPDWRGRVRGLYPRLGSTTIRMAVSIYSWHTTSPGIPPPSPFAETQALAGEHTATRVSTRLCLTRCFTTKAADASVTSQAKVESRNTRAKVWASPFGDYNGDGRPDI